MESLIAELQDTKTRLETTISGISESDFNKIPYQDGWTAAQVGEHVLNAIGTSVLYGETKSTDRKPDEKVAQTGNLFLNLDIKMQSPDFIYPSDKKHTKAEILAKVDDSFSKLINAAKALDLSLTCVAFEIPGFGPFTRLEFLWFYIFHTQRHLFQFQKIKKALAN